MSKEKENKKLPFKAFSKKGLAAFALAGVMLSTPFALAGCGEAGPAGKDGATGATGASGKSAYELAVENGFTGTVQEWLDSLKGNAGNSVVSVVKTATNGLVDTYTITFSDGTTTTFDVTNGADGGIGPQGPEGPQGSTGQDGTSVYVGYDGYIWNGAERTEYSADVNLNDGVVENTIGIEGVMSKYFDGSYMDLSSNSIALMSNYMANINMTRYSDSKVYEIKVITEESGKLYVGKAKVADVVNARATGNTYTPTMQEYDVVAGLNTIALNIHIAEDETIVLGGQGSVGLYMTSGIPVNDESGNFTLINNQTHTDIISNNGTYADTLAVQVKAEFVGQETELTPNALDFLRTTEINPNNSVNVSSASNNFIYVNNFFGNSEITEIAVPITTSTVIGAPGEAQPSFTVKVVNYGTLPISIKKTYKITIPYEKLKDVAVKGSGTYTINRWVHVDVSNLNIVLEENETLAFLDKSDTTVSIGYEKITSNTIEPHDFAYTTVGLNTWDKEPSNIHFAFGVYGKRRGITLEEQIEKLEAKAKNVQLSNALAGKNISILGDSISTYLNWSNNASYNTTLTENGTNAYNGVIHGIANVDQTWWKQTIDKTGMNLLVNNAKSGAQASNSASRAQQLHCDTGDKSGTNPDIISVYIGINDIRYNGITGFESAYRTMLQNIKTKYTTSDVYVFTLIPERDHEKATDAVIQQANDIIENLASEFGCTVVDVYGQTGINIVNSGLYMYDYLHPNIQGMELISQCFMDVLYENYVTNAD